MKNIGFLHIFGFPIGGVERVTSNLAATSLNKKFRFFVFTFQINSDLLTVTDKENITIIEINRADFVRELEQKTQENKIDILVFTSRVPNFEEIVKNLQCKTIFAYHMSGPFIKNKSKRGLYIFIKNKDISFFQKLKEIKKRIQEIIEEKNIIVKEFKAYYSYTSAFVVLHKHYKTLIEKIITNSNSCGGGVKIIPNGLPQPPMVYSLQKKKQLLYIGRLTFYDKRVDRLIAIWKRIYKKFPDWELRIVGDGKELPNLKKQAQNLQRIYFEGQTNEPFCYYNESSILCMTSEYEGIPMVILEAQQAGVIPIAFNCSEGVKSVLSPSWENGVLIKKYNMKAYEKALCQLMNSENLRKKIQKNILKKSQDYDIETIVQQWDVLFENVLISS